VGLRDELVQSRLLLVFDLTVAVDVCVGDCKMKPK
jgi:hypothetical protein